MPLPDPIVTISAHGPDLTPAIHGTKAVGLQQLLRCGLAVPPCLVVPISGAAALADTGIGDGAGEKELVAALAGLGGPHSLLAVRSGAAVSLPGIYLTVVDVLPETALAALVAVVESSRGVRAETLVRSLGYHAPPPTAVVIQRQVDATADARSGAGAATSRHPVSGEATAAGSFGWQVRGAAVMAAAVPVADFDAIADRLPKVHAQLLEDLARLDAELGTTVEIEFAVESGRLWYLQLRAFSVTSSRAELPAELRRAELPAEAVVIATGQSASAGIGRGEVHVDVDDALEAVDAGRAVILVLETTSPADVTAMVRSAAVLTVIGGRESHAAVITRAAGVPAVLAVQGLEIGPDAIRIGGIDIPVGEELLVDGTTGRVARLPEPAGHRSG